MPFRIEDMEIGDDLYYYVSSMHWLDALFKLARELPAKIEDVPRLNGMGP